MSNNLSNDVFVDEISESLILTEKNQNNKFFPWLLILFCLLSLIVSLFFMYKIGLFGFNNKKYVERNLLVVYSTNNFGDTINDFSTYNSYDNAYFYNFSIINGNSEELTYNIILNVSNIKNGYDISYEIDKNSKSLFNGCLADEKEYLLTSQKILSGVTDEYRLKLWNQVDTDSSIKFKIEVKN